MNESKQSVDSKFKPDKLREKEQKSDFSKTVENTIDKQRNSEIQVEKKQDNKPMVKEPLID